MELRSGEERFTADDLRALSDLVASTWTVAADRDWSAQAGTVEWTCLKTADHAVDCVYAPAFFLTSRRQDAYPDIGLNLELGEQATPALLVESLAIATRLLIGAVAEAGPDVRSIIFRRPEMITAAREDFLPRGALELILHAHDVSVGLEVAFEPPADLCHRLREHTRPWPMWSMGWSLASTDDPWGDLLAGTHRSRLVS